MNKNISNYFNEHNVHTDYKNKNTNTERMYAAYNKVSYPQLFERLAIDQRRDAKRQIQSLPLQTQQNLLDEWQARCLKHDIYNPAGYLFGMLKKAKAGEFRACEILKDKYE